MVQPDPKTQRIGKVIAVMQLRRIITVLIGIAASILFSSSSLLADSNDDFFETTIRPLLVEHCLKCHGAQKQWGNLRLDSREALLKGGEHGTAIVPGKPADSLLIKALQRQGDLQMPPDEPLSEKQIASFEHWIQINAPWPKTSTTDPASRLSQVKDHWAFQPVRVVDPPAVPVRLWNQNPIDQFVWSRLSNEGLTPSPPADRRALLRRATYNLTGLPPSPSEIDAFVRSEDPNEYQRQTERLLASKEYGEHWARHWLDVARYSDTKGYVYAREERFWVHAAAYRDWVVDAFQNDLPYDRFLLLQIAADQIAPDELESLAAMGFLTLGRRFLGVTPDIVDDRIDVVTRGTMGLTVACARCHDHKYDPIPTSDYYSLYGVFLNSREQLSRIEFPTNSDAATEHELETRLTKLRETMATKRREAAEQARKKVADYLVAQTDLVNVPPEGFDLILAKDDLIPTFVRHWDAYLTSVDRIKDPVFRPWVRLSKLIKEDWSLQVDAVLSELNSADRQSVNERIMKELTPAPASFREMTARYGQVFLAVDQQWKDACQSAMTSGSPAPTSLPDPADEAIRKVMYGDISPCAIPDEPIVATESFFDSASCDELWKLQDEVDRWLINTPQSPRHAVKLVDRAWRQPSFVFRRGNPKSKGDRTDPHFLSILSGGIPKSFTDGSGRRELALAIVDPKNPLTARVWVNRIWHHHFGEGLVTTPSDFGVRSEPPSHPELLDWLAAELMRQNWSTKAIHRLILNSQTYQQSSKGPDDAAARLLAQQKDPANHTLWRMSSHRLTFEEMRDSLLSVSARLNAQSGGRASDMFAGNGLNHQRRTLYGLVDRQFLATSLRIFDFPNPDLHIPRRSDTIVPQQALFSLNHPLMAETARSIIARIEQRMPTANSKEWIRELYRTIYQRDLTDQQMERAIQFIEQESNTPVVRPRQESFAWSYGWGQLDEAAQKLNGFSLLPYFTGKSWQGAAEWPGGGLGWLQLTAEGGHTGDDLQHAVVRRWTAPHDGHYSIESRAIHEEAAGDGVRFHIVASRGGILKSVALHNRSEEMRVDPLDIKAGDTIDFVVDFNANLNCDQHLWSPRIIERSNADAGTTAAPHVWDAGFDFSGPVEQMLKSKELLVQVLLMSNEFLFVD